MSGFNRGLPPGLAGFEAAGQVAMQRDEHALRQNLGAMQLRGMLEQMRAGEDKRKTLEEFASSLPPAERLKFRIDPAGYLKNNRPDPKGQAAMQLAGLLSGATVPADKPGEFVGTEAEALARFGVKANPDGTYTQVGPEPTEPTRVYTPDQNVVRGLAVAAEPEKAIPELLRQQRPQNQKSGIRPVSGGYVVEKPDGSAEFVATGGGARKRIIATGSGYMEIGEDGKPTPLMGSDGKQLMPPSMAQSATKERMTDEAVRDLAIQSLYDPNSLAGYRRDTDAMSRIQNMRMRVMNEARITSEDVVSGRAGFKADTASLNKITPQYDAITAFENTAIRNGKILIDLAKKADTTGVPAVERWIRAGRQATGDPDVAKFNAQLHLYRAEAARILTQPNLSGVLSDSAREEMKEFLQGGASAKQIEDVVTLLERDFHNRKSTLEDQIASIRLRMKGRVSPAAPAAPQAAAPAAPAPAAPANPGWKITPIP